MKMKKIDDEVLAKVREYGPIHSKMVYHHLLGGHTFDEVKNALRRLQGIGKIIPTPDGYVLKAAQPKPIKDGTDKIDENAKMRALFSDDGTGKVKEIFTAHHDAQVMRLINAALDKQRKELAAYCDRMARQFAGSASMQLNNSDAMKMAGKAIAFQDVANLMRSNEPLPEELP